MALPAVMESRKNPASCRRSGGSAWRMSDTRPDDERPMSMTAFMASESRSPWSVKASAREFMSADFP